ncbi:MAG: ABC transporter permease [Planctomycetota bacterium]
MTTYFIRRLLLVPVTFIAITLMIYAILRIVPGGPIEQAEAKLRTAQMTEGGSSGGDSGEEDLQLSGDDMKVLEEYYSLDQPIPIGYLQWLGVLPRKRSHRVPRVPAEEHATEHSRLLAAKAGGDDALRATEEETGYYVDEHDDLVQLAFRPLHRLNEARNAAEEQLGDLLEPKDLVEYRGRVYRPLTESEEKENKRFIEEAESLKVGGYAKRGHLLEHLAERDMTIGRSGFAMLVGPDERAKEPALYERAEALAAARVLANRKLSVIEEERGFQIEKDGRIYGIETGFHGILQLDFGTSYTYNKPVLSLIGSKMEVSIQFGLIGYFLTWLICVPLGVMKAIKHRTGFDTASSVLVFIGYSIPGFVLCLLLLSTVAVHVDWLPLGGYKPDNIEEMGAWEALLGRIRHMLIPVAGYMIGGFATMTILMKNSLLDNLGADYVRTAFAKGLSEKRVIFVHALRNSLIPVTAGIGHALGLLFAGSFLIEKTCNIDGMGLLGFEAIQLRDYPITLGLMVFLILIRLFGNILSDVIWALIDPRIRFGK